MDDMAEHLATGGVRFDISNGQVTGEERVVGSHTISLHLPADATFVVGTGTVTETLAGSHTTTTLQYVQDSTDATLYHLASETLVVAQPSTTNAHGGVFGYGFTISNGAVTAMSVTEGHGSHTGTHDLRIAPTATFTVGTGTVTETVVHGNEVATINYVQTGTSGLYAVASTTETIIQAGTATTRLDVEPFERDTFAIDASGAVGQVQRVLADGTLKTVAASTATTYTQLAPGYVVAFHTQGTHSSYEVFNDGNGDGIYTAVAHGAGTTVDLVGLQAQISSAIHAVL